MIENTVNLISGAFIGAAAFGMMPDGPNYVTGSSPPVRFFNPAEIRLSGTSFSTGFGMNSYYELDSHNYVERYTLKDLAEKLAKQSRDFTPQESAEYKAFLDEYFS